MATPLHRLIDAQTEVAKELEASQKAIENMQNEVDKINASIVLLRLESVLLEERRFERRVGACEVMSDIMRWENVMRLVIEANKDNDKMRVTIDGDMHFDVVVTHTSS